MKKLILITFVLISVNITAQNKRVSEYKQTDVLYDNDLFEVAQINIYGNYTTKAIKYKDLRTNFYYDKDQDIRDLREQINNLENKHEVLYWVVIIFGSVLFIFSIIMQNLYNKIKEFEQEKNSY